MGRKWLREAGPDILHWEGMGRYWVQGIWDLVTMLNYRKTSPLPSLGSGVGDDKLP